MHIPEAHELQFETAAPLQPNIEVAEHTGMMRKISLRVALAAGVAVSSLMGGNVYAADGDNREAPAVVADLPYFADTHLDCGPVITSHRGWIGAAENTIPGIRKGLNAGADAVEIDVRKTKDGQLIILHDATLNRTTNGAGPVKDKTYARISRFRANNGARIPLLQDALRAVANFGTGDRKVQFDLKVELGPRDVESIMGWVDQFGLTDRVIFAATQISRARKFSDQGQPTGYILPTGVWRNPANVPEFFDTINADRRTATPRRVRRAARAGFGTLERHIYSKAHTNEVIEDKGVIVMSDDIEASVAAC